MWGHDPKVEYHCYRVSDFSVSYLKATGVKVTCSSYFDKTFTFLHITPRLQGQLLGVLPKKFLACVQKELESNHYIQLWRTHCTLSPPSAENQRSGLYKPPAASSELRVEYEASLWLDPDSVTGCRPHRVMGGAGSPDRLSLSILHLLLVHTTSVYFRPED